MDDPGQLGKSQIQKSEWDFLKKKSKTKKISRIFERTADVVIELAEWMERVVNKAPKKKRPLDTV